LTGVLRGIAARSGIEIQGHTDDSPVIKQRKIYPSNWELSTARAASLVRAFEDAGFLKSNLKVVGFGDSRPMVPNRTPDGKVIEENLVKNRRIVLRVLPERQREDESSGL
jgi:chemotaxis protein MotB